MADISFSDQQRSELRPVIIISKNNYTENSNDAVICGITTNSGHAWHLPIKKEDLEYGQLFDGSGARADMITRVLKYNLKFKVAKITEEYHKRLVGKINELIA